MIEIYVTDRGAIEVQAVNESGAWHSITFTDDGAPFLKIIGGANLRAVADSMAVPVMWISRAPDDNGFMQRFREYTAAERIKEQNGGKQPDLDAFVNHRYAPDPLAEPAGGRKMFVDVDSCSFDRVGEGYLRVTDEEGNEIATFGPSMTTAMAKHALGVANRAYAIGRDVGAWRVRWEIRRAMGIDRENQ